VTKRVVKRWFVIRLVSDGFNWLEMKDPWEKATENKTRELKLA